MSVLGDLRDQGLIEKVTSDRTLAAGWLEDSQRHLQAANQIAELDPSGAYVLAYDAARKSVAAALLMSGHRVLSRPGAHRALADYANWLATKTGEQALTASTGSDEIATSPNTGRAHSEEQKLPKPSTLLKRFERPARNAPDSTTENEISRPARIRCGWRASAPRQAAGEWPVDSSHQTLDLII